MASKLKITRTERQAQVIENWKRVNCRGVFEGCTGFGIPVEYLITPNLLLEVYFVSDFIEHAVLPKELAELLSGNIGEMPEKENPEINLESNESKSSYSVEGETL